MRRRSPSRFFPVEAEQLLQAGDVVNATELCKYGLVYFPENISGYAVLAQAYLMLEQPERAMNVLENGYRRTGAEGLRGFSDRIREVSEGETEEKIADEENVGERSAEEMPDSILSSSEIPLDETEEMSESSEEDLSTEDVPSPEVIVAPSFPDSSSGETVSEIEEGEADLEAQPTEEAPPSETPSVLSLSEDEVLTERRGEFRFVLLDESEEEVDGEEPIEQIMEEEEEVTEEDPSSDFAFFISIDPKIEEGEWEVETREDPVALREEERASDVEGIAERVQEESPETPVSVTEERLEVTGSVAEDEPDVVGEPESVGSAVVEPEMREEPVREVVNEKQESASLSIHSGSSISRLRSSNLRLIPGLEFAPLRRDEPKLRITPLVRPAAADPEPPLPQPDIQSDLPASSQEKSGTDIPLPPPSEFSEPLPDESPANTPLTPLEELARRLETARIPVIAEEERVEMGSPAFEPSIVSDTFANILAQQGAYHEAIKAYQMLARMKPERRAEYEQKIEEMRWKLTSIVGKDEG